MKNSMETLRNMVKVNLVKTIISAELQTRYVRFNPETRNEQTIDFA